MKNLKNILLSLFIFASLIAHSQSPEVSITTGHAGLIMRVALAPQGNLVASNGADHLIKIWDKSSGKEITTLSNKVKGVDNEQRIESMKFFDDGEHLFTSDENGTLKVWNIKEEKIIKSFEGTRGISGLSADIAGNRIVYTDKSLSLVVADLDNRPLKIIPDLNILNIKIVPDNPDQIFAVDLQKNYFIYDIVKEEKLIQFENTGSFLLKAAISQNGKYLAGVYGDMTLTIWDIKTGAVIKKLTGMKPHEIKFHPKTNELMVLHSDNKTGENLIYIYDNKKFELIRKVINIGSFATIMDLSANGKYIAINSSQFENNAYSYTINLINWKSGKKIKTLKSRAHAVWQIAAAKNSPRIASLCGDLNLRIWNISTLQIEKVFPYIQKIAVNGTGNILAMRGYNAEIPGYNAIMFWDLDSAKFKGFIPFTDILFDMKFCADNKHIIVMTFSNEIAVWNINSKIYNTETKETIIIEEAHSMIGASDLKFSSDGKYLLTGSFDQEVAAWETGTWKKIASYTGNIGPVSCVNINFDNDELASGAMGSTVTESDYAVNVWNTSQHELICSLIGHELAVNSIAFNKQNRLLFSGSTDGTIKVWNLNSCKEIMSCISIDYEDYIFVTPDYHYTGSKDALKGVGFKMNGTKLYPFEQYDLRLNRPDIIAERLNIAPANLIKAFKRAYQKRLEKMGYNEDMLNNDFTIPTLIIENKNDIAFQSKSNELTIDISASDKTYPLDRINIWINDVPIYGRDGINLKDNNAEKINKKIKLQLSEGKNKIQVSVLNSKGVESLKETIEIIAPELKKKPDLYIVAVGVSDYMNDEYDLNYAAKDANDLTAIFEKKKDKFENIHIIKILDHDATKENILKTKKELEKTRINDLVIIYTAGHGFLNDNLDYFFATTDIDIFNPSKNGLSYEELESLLENIPARKKLLLMDACHSGEIDFDEYDLYVDNMSDNVVARSVYVSKTSASHIGLDNSFRLMKELFADLRRGSGAVVISSAGGVEYAFESDKLKNGVFTYVLINALKLLKANDNGDNSITISELQKYVMKTVSDLTKGRQNPTVRRENLEFDFEVW
ncbi:MAG: caspase family protein [Bacteroidales bacterium]|nr:caspase family protein [Bacteroidales bacterium]